MTMNGLNYMGLPRIAARLFLAVATVWAIAAIGCATVPDGDPDARDAVGADAAEDDALRAAPTEPFPRVSLSLDFATLGEAVRQLGEQQGGSLVIMNGLEGRPIGRVAHNQVAFDRVAEGWADRADCAIQKTPNYYFIYPSGYESLTELSIAGDMDPRYDAIREPMTFGAGMNIFVLFKWIGEALDLTIVADNIVGEAGCGEFSMGSVPLGASLEALLKSARIADAQVDSTEDYIFVAQPRAWMRRPTLINEASLSERQREFLGQRVTVRLPESRRSWPTVELEFAAVPLADALSTLSDQLGIRVVAEPEIADLPVNPVYMHDVTVRTAMDLLIWQWPLPQFGYQFISDRIVIRQLTPAEMNAQREQYMAR